MWVGALVSAVIGNILPGPGTLYKSQSFNFMNRVRVGDELTVAVTVREKLDGGCVRLDTVITGRGGEKVADGVAEVFAPVRKMSSDDTKVPEIPLQRHRHFDRLVQACNGLPPIVTAVVAPEEKAALAGALLAAEQDLIRPILIGSAARITAVARDIGANIQGRQIVDVASDEIAANAAVELARSGRVQAIMKGHLHTDALLHPVLKHESGLRTNRRASHVFVMDVPGLEQVLIVSDAAINIAPDLEAKVDITQNAIDVALALGIDKPKVGILSAVETVTPKIPSTLDAAILAKMADRGQIRGAVVDGPLAMDNAIDIEAARTKGITSLVAGHADILIVPNLEAGNMLAKELVFVAQAEAAGLVLGCSSPIILTSRADGEKARLASCAIAALYRAWHANGIPKIHLERAAE